MKREDGVLLNGAERGREYRVHFEANGGVSIRVWEEHYGGDWKQDPECGVWLKDVESEALRNLLNARATPGPTPSGEL